jgi:hypothetical protein
MLSRYDLPMQLFTVTCRRSLPGWQWDKREALVIATSAAEAEELCRQKCAAEGFTPVQEVTAPAMDKFLFRVGHLGEAAQKIIEAQRPPP